MMAIIAMVGCQATLLGKVAAEGIEALKEVSGSVDDVLANLIGGVQSGMGYLGASSLDELRKRARYIRVTPAGQKESAPPLAQAEPIAAAPMPADEGAHTEASPHADATAPSGSAGSTSPDKSPTAADTSAGARRPGPHTHAPVAGWNTCVVWSRHAS